MKTSHSDIPTSQFEAVKLAVKQDKEGFVLTLRMHPDEVPEEILRDFVGSRYQVVMVRLNGTDQPLDRQKEFEKDRSLKLAHSLCKNKDFWEFLQDDGQIFDASEEEAANWLREYAGISSRSEFQTNEKARQMLDTIYREFLKWQRT